MASLYVDEMNPAPRDSMSPNEMPPIIAPGKDPNPPSTAAEKPFNPIISPH